MNLFPDFEIACEGLKVENDSPRYIQLEHREGGDKNTKIKLDKFVTHVETLKDRFKDLLVMAGYIFAADRRANRGSIKAEEFTKWSREFTIHLKVRDLNFWDKETIKKLLNDALCFMSGDHKYHFKFYQAEPDFPTSIFDNDEFQPRMPEDCKIALFSGGIDSLSGVIDLLHNSKSEIWLASHQSGSTKTKMVQRRLFAALNERYPGRCQHYKYQCGLTGEQASDESQRTRPFLYFSTAFALAAEYNQKEITVFENGITSINFPETQDLMNSRASRTTHPKTIALLERLYSAIAEEPFTIRHPYLLKTKTDIVEILKTHNRLDLLDSSVSCSGTRKNMSNFTHCGACNQCIDRIFATYAAEVEKYDDNGIYRFSFLKEDLEEPHLIKLLNEYIRLAHTFKCQDIESFYLGREMEVLDAVEFMKGERDEDKIEAIFTMCRKHADQIEKAVNRMRKQYDSIFIPNRPLSFFSLVLGKKEYQKEPEEISKEATVRQEIPIRGLKVILIENLKELIAAGRITEGMNETKREPELSKIVTPYIERKYILTPAQKHTIQQYLLRGDIQLKKQKGGFTVVDGYIRR